MPTPSRLQRLLQRDVLLAGTAALAVFNGLPLTAFFDSIAYILYLFTRGSSLIDQDVLYYLTTLLIAVMTLLVGGIPAALYERLRGVQASTPASLGIWLAATALLALPALASAAGLW